MSNPNPTPRPLSSDDALGDGRRLFKRPTSPWPSQWEIRNGITPVASEDWHGPRPDAWGGTDAATAEQQRQAAAARLACWQAYYERLSAASREKYPEPNTLPEWFD